MVIGQTGERVDLVVLGGGPGGYSAAVRGAQLGLSVVLVERGEVGGVCLNQGCIPSKALLSAARLTARARDGGTMGIDATVRVDLARMQAWKRGVVANLAGGVRRLLQQWGVRLVRGEGRFAGERRVAVDTGEDVAFFEFGSAIVATGSRPLDPTGLSPEEALELEALPPALTVLGGGYVAVELATAFARLGSRVSLRSEGDLLLPEMEEPLLSRAVAGGLRRLGVTLVTGGAAPPAEEAVVVDARRRAPNTGDLGLGRVGIRPDADGRLAVDPRQRTAVHAVFAVGDVTPGPLLAHRAIAEGRVAAEAAAGLPSATDRSVTPLTCFSEPEVATAGLTERAARSLGMDVAAARFPLAASGRAQSLGLGDGFLQIVAERGTGRVVGVQIAGPGATELIGEAALAIEMTATLEDLALTLHAHPTLSEAFVEAADLLLERPRHIYRRGAGRT